MSSVRILTPPCRSRRYEVEELPLYQGQKYACVSDKRDAVYVVHVPEDSSTEDLRRDLCEEGDDESEDACLEAVEAMVPVRWRKMSGGPPDVGLDLWGRRLQLKRRTSSSSQGGRLLGRFACVARFEGTTNTNDAFVQIANISPGPRDAPPSPPEAVELGRPGEYAAWVCQALLDAVEAWIPDRLPPSPEHIRMYDHVADRGSSTVAKFQRRFGRN